MPDILAHAVTRYDRENQAWAAKGKRRYHNPYALGIYLQRVEECNAMVQEGMTPALHTTNAITEGDPIVAGAAVVDAFGSDGQELFVGIAAATCSTDETLKHIPAIMKLFAPANTATAP